MIIVSQSLNENIFLKTLTTQLVDKQNWCCDDDFILFI